MSIPRQQHFILKQNNVEVEILSGEMSFVPDAKSTATFHLDPSLTDVIALDAADSFDVYKVEKNAAGTDLVSLVMKGATAVSSQYTGEFVPVGPGGGGEVRRVRAIRLQDRLAGYQNNAPGAPADLTTPDGPSVTHTNTDSHQELRFVAAQIGSPGAVSNCPVVAIPRIDYTRDGGWWAALWPYFAPWSPLIFVEPSSGYITVLDVTTYDSTLSRAQAPITDETCNEFQPVEIRLILPDQYRVDYLLLSGDDTTIKRDVIYRRENEQRIEEDDGSTTVLWDWVIDLKENPEDSTTVTRTVPAGDGQTHVNAARQETSEQSTQIYYEADYIRPRETLTITKARVTLPGASSSTYRVVETTTEKTTYQPHPLLAGRYILDHVVKATEGIYVYTNTGNPTLDLRTATPILEATLAQTVDGSASSSQTWAEGPMRKRTDVYRRTGGAGIVTQSVVELDVLRGTQRTQPDHRMNIGDITVGSDGFAAFTYRPVGALAGTRAEIIDATRIGRELGIELADAKLARSNSTERNVTLQLSRTEYYQYRLGWVVTLAADAIFEGFSGPYLCVGVSFTLNPTDPTAGTSNRPTVEERLSLTRQW